MTSARTLSRPEPRHCVQGDSTRVPAPAQVGQGVTMAKKPCVRLTCPRPAQVSQVLREVPGLAPVPLQPPQ